MSSILATRPGERVSPSGKASGFDPDTRGFDSRYPNPSSSPVRTLSFHDNNASSNLVGDIIYWVETEGIVEQTNCS